MIARDPGRAGPSTLRDMTTPAETTVLSVPEISCGHCKAAIEGALSGVDGVDAAEVDITAKTVRVAHDPARADRAALVAAIEDQGYEVPAQ